MSDKIGSKTPAQTHNDLFYLNNNNIGLDATLRTVYSGNGEETKIELSKTQCKIDFGKGACIKPVLENYRIKSNNIGTIPNSYELKIINGNIQKIDVSEDVTLSITADLDTDTGVEITLLVNQMANDKKISFNGNVKTPNGTSIDLSGDTGSLDIIKIITMDAGTTWYAFLQHGNLK
jgi:hypothetical protein